MVSGGDCVEFVPLLPIGVVPLKMFSSGNRRGVKLLLEGVRQ
jgi:hypothetical protein